MIDARDAYIYWDVSKRDVAVFDRETARVFSRKYRYSGGAAYTWVREEATDYELSLYLLREAYILIVDFGMDAAQVDKEFSKIKQFKDAMDLNIGEAA